MNHDYSIPILKPAALDPLTIQSAGLGFRGVIRGSVDMKVLLIETFGRLVWVVVEQVGISKVFEVLVLKFEVSRMKNFLIFFLILHTYRPTYT